MFQNGPRSQTPAEYSRQRAGRAVTAAARYEAAEDWFDGTVDSVDRRLAVCDKLLHQARSALGMGGLGTSGALSRVASLETDRQGMTELRASLLQSAQDRHVGRVDDLVRTAAAKMAILSDRDRRYVELEAAKIVRANADCSDHDEIAERTERIAAVETSSMSPRRSRAITEALTGRVVQLAQRNRRPVRTASRPAVVQDFPAELMFY